MLSVVHETPCDPLCGTQLEHMHRYMGGADLKEMLLVEPVIPVCPPSCLQLSLWQQSEQE